MTKFEPFRTLRLLSSSVVVRIAVVTIMVIVMFLVFMLNPTFANKYLLYAKEKNSSMQIGPDLISANIEDQQNRRQISNKLVILTFGDIHKSQFATARPILDKYNFKGSFFVPCDMVGEGSRMDWDDIKTLYNEGHAIQAKSDDNLIDLSRDKLDSEVSQPKECLSAHGLNPSTITTFAVRHGNAVSNSTVINMVAKYYDMAINGFSNLMRLNCTGYEDQPNSQRVGSDELSSLVTSPRHQTDCRTFYDDGSITDANRYSIREWNHNAKDRKYAYNSTSIFNTFVQVVNSQTKYNNNGVINAIPLIAYHNIDNNRGKSSTDTSLFEAEMKYLHDNGFKVITINDLAYDEMSNRLYVKNTLQ
ncbi:MAG TPA: polysaccharide deacetylase family protein [Nitrososphaeraceae archaeon]